MREKVWINGNKWKCETGHRTFDGQASRTIITDACVWSDVQHSGGVRASEYQTMPTGQGCAPGVLFNFDMQFFRESGMDERTVRRIRQYASTVFHEGDRYPDGEPDVIMVYQFHHWYRPKPDSWMSHVRGCRQKYVHGWVVTTGALNGRRLIEIIPNGQYRAKSMSVLEYCAEIVSNSPASADTEGAVVRERQAAAAAKRAAERRAA